MYICMYVTQVTCVEIHYQIIKTSAAGICPGPTYVGGQMSAAEVLRRAANRDEWRTESISYRPVHTN